MASSQLQTVHSSDVPVLTAAESASAAALDEGLRSTVLSGNLDSGAKGVAHLRKVSKVSDDARGVRRRYFRL